MSQDEQRIYCREGTEYGRPTGGTRTCFDGCIGRRIAVRWPGGELTYPCSKGLFERDDGHRQIG